VTAIPTAGARVPALAARSEGQACAREIAVILAPCGYAPDEIERVQRFDPSGAGRGGRKRWRTPPASCFIETQLTGLAERMDHALLLDVHPQDCSQDERRTASRFVGDIPLDERARNVLAEALTDSGSVISIRRA